MCVGIAQYVDELYAKHFGTTRVNVDGSKQSLQHQQQQQQHEDRRRLSEDLVSAYRKAFESKVASEPPVVELDGRTHRVAHRLSIVAGSCSDLHEKNKKGLESKL